MTVEEWLALRRHARRCTRPRAKAQAMGIDVIWDCELRQDARGLLPGPGRHRRTRSPSRWRRRRSPTCCGWRPRRPTSPTRKRVRRGDPRRLPRQDAGLQPVAVLQLGHHRHERRGDARASRRSSGKLGFVFNFITYGGHQIDGLAAEEFATALREDGMLALARLQRKFRLLESPYRTPQTLVGGPRADAALMAVVGPHRHHQGDGQGLDAAPAPGPDRGAAEAAGGAGSATWAEHHERRRAAARSRCGRTPPARSCWS